MHEPLLALAALPAQAAVCGIPLRDYSLGHEVFLTRESNAFTLDFDEHGRIREKLPEIFHGDLLEAVWICSSTWLECKQASASWSYLLKLWLLKRKVKRCNIAREAAAFREYRNMGSLMFPLSDITDPRKPTPRPPGAPWILRLHAFLVAQYRLTIPQAWDFPLGEAKMRWGQFYEQEGGLNIYSEADASFDRYIAEQEAKGAEQCPA
jgi:hypothetical protein